MDNQKTGTAGAEGVDYQLNLILLCLLRSVKAYGDKFKLTTELKSVGKFDDLILFYTSNDDGKNYQRCLQAKHKVNENNHIALDDLLIDSKKGFNLYAYFKTYRELLLEPNDTILKDIIIFTNLKFNDNVKKFLDPIPTPDNLFHFGDAKTDGTVPALFRFNPEFREMFKYSKLIKLAQQLLEYSHIKKIEMKHNNNTFKDYHNVLAKYVIDVKNKCFYSSFITGDGITDPTALVFRDIFLSEVKSQPNYVDSSNELNVEEFVIKLSGDFGSKPCEVWPKGTTLSEKELEDVDSFFNQLIFGANQPNEQELKHYIQNEMCSFYKTSKAETTLCMLNLIDMVRGWFKEKEISYLSKTEMDQFSNFVNQQIAALNLLNVSEMFCEELRSAQINFQTINFQQEIISFLCDKEKRIFYLQALKNYTRLSSIKMLHSLQNTETTCKFLFIPLKKEIMTKTISLISYFVASEDCNILAMEVFDSRLLDAIYFQLGKVVSEQKDKKIIIISDEFSLAREYQAIGERFCDDTPFNHLTQDTRTNLLNRQVTLQGYLVTLREVICEAEVSRFDSTDWWVPLMFSEAIIVGPELQISNGYNPKYYIARRLFQVRVILEEDIEIIKDHNLILTSFDELYAQVDYFTKLLAESNDSLWIWDKPRGRVLNVRRHLISDNEINVNENSKLQIISAKAGLGKSTIISHIIKQSKEADPGLWAIRLNLVAFSTELSQFQEAMESYVDEWSSGIRRFLAKTLLNYPENSIEESLFNMRIGGEVESKMIFIFDGFDEVDDLCQDAVIAIVKDLLSRASVKRVIVSTRPDFQEKLENKFSQFAIQLDPFSNNDKIQFLTRYWSHCAEIENNITQDQEPFMEKMETFAKRVLLTFTNKISDDQAEITGIPLQMRMIAEILESDAMNYARGELITDIIWSSVSVLNIYEQFIEKKKLIFLKEKGQFNVCNPLQQAALNQIVTKIGHMHVELGLKSEYAKLDDADSEMIRCMLQFGLVHERNGKLFFIHRTFAEYYIALFLMQKIIVPNFDSEEFIEGISSARLWNTRLFVNDMLTSNDTYEYVKRNFKRIIKDMAINGSFIESLIYFYCLDGDNSKILEVLLDSIHEVDRDNDSPELIKFLVRQLNHFLNDENNDPRMSRIKTIIDHAKSRYSGTSTMHKRLVFFIVNVYLFSVLTRETISDPLKDITRYFIEFLIFVEKEKLVDGEFIDQELKSIWFLRVDGKGREIFLMFLNYIYDHKIAVFEDILKINSHEICDPRNSAYSKELEMKTNISSSTVLAIMSDSVIRRMYKHCDLSPFISHLSTFLAHTKEKYNVEEINMITDAAFTESFEEHFKKNFTLSTGSSMDKILCDFIVNNCEKSLLNNLIVVRDYEKPQRDYSTLVIYITRFLPILKPYFIQDEDTGLSQIEYCCLWGKFEILKHLLNDGDEESLRRKSVDILNSMKRRLSPAAFQYFINERNEYKETILHRACRENESRQIRVITSWIDSDEVFNSLTSLRSQSYLVFGASLFSQIIEIFPDKIEEFLLHNCHVYLHEIYNRRRHYGADEELYKERNRKFFDILLKFFEQRMSKDSLYKLLTKNSSTFAKFCCKMIHNDYYLDGVGRLLQIVESKGFENADIFLLMSQKSIFDEFHGDTLHSSDYGCDLTPPPKAKCVMEFMEKHLTEAQITEIFNSKNNWPFFC